MENVLSVARMFNELYRADHGEDLDSMRSIPGNVPGKDWLPMHRRDPGTLVSMHRETSLAPIPGER